MHVRALKVSMSELREQAYQLRKWAYRDCGSELVSCESEHVRVVGASMSESWESECALVRVAEAGLSELKSPC